MIKTCQQCGAVNGDPSDVCCFCDAPLGGLGRSSISRRVTTLTEGRLAVEPEWRREVSNRLQDYRARRRGDSSAALQTALPFASESPHFVESSSVATEPLPPAPARKSAVSRTIRHERFEIPIPRMEAAADPLQWLAPAAVGATRSPRPLRFVASLSDRRRAALVDVGLLLFSYGGMLALFAVLGGRIGLNRVDLSVALATLALFYAQYFALFTVFGGSTPGMMVRGLRVVTFDGGIPTSRQMSWRSFGYLISAGMCFLGFVWSVWDDDQLCWHDRISQTFLTPVDEHRLH